MKKLSLKAIPLTAFVLVGCGGQPQEPALTEIITQMEGFPKNYRAGDTSCTPAEGLMSLGDQRVRLWEEGTLVEKRVTFDFASSKGGLTGPTVSQVLVDLEHLEESDCTVGTDRVAKCKSQIKVRNPGRLLSICQENKEYSPDSYEQVALTTLYGIEKAAHFYQSIESGAKATLTQLKLQILPKLLTKTHAKFPDGRRTENTATFVNNAAYSHRSDWLGGRISDSVMLFFPHDVAFKSTTRANVTPLQEPSFWEVPFIVAHEFGHHVFFLNTPSIRAFTAYDGPLSTRSMNEWQQGPSLPGFPTQPDSLPSFPNPLRNPLSLSAVTQSGKTISPLATMIAVNEAFADLYAFYTHGAKKGLLKDLSCFGDKRDVVSRMFNDIERKALTSQDLTTYFYPESRSEALKPGCENVNMADPHIVGAVIAHGLDRLFSMAVGSSESDPLAQEKAALLMSWVAGVNDALQMLVPEERRGTLQVEELLRQSVAAGLVVATENGKTLTAEQCLVVNDVFRAYGEGSRRPIIRNAAEGCEVVVR